MQRAELFAPLIYTLKGFTRNPLPGNLRALDVGCGGRKLPGAVGMDLLDLPGVDVVHNANTMPWPLKDAEFDVVFLNHALEHVGDVVAVMEEIHRVLRPGGRVVIQVPYFRCTDAYNDPTHTHFFTSHTLDYFLEGTGLSQYSYSTKLFRKKGFWYGWPHPSRHPLKRAFRSFVADHPDFYDQYLSLLFPTECLTWELEVVK